jgi:hypothetical protein
VSVRIEIALLVDGDGEVETSLREHCAWLETRRYHAEYYEVIACLAMMMARMSWADADLYQRLEQESGQRRDKARQRKPKEAQ